MKTNTQFAALLKDILTYGQKIDTRNSVTTRKCNLIATFKETPLVTLRKTAWKNALREMEYFLKGGTHLDDLHPSVHHWWAPFCTKIPSSMPYSYGYQLNYRYIENPSLTDVVKVERKTVQILENEEVEEFKTVSYYSRARTMWSNIIKSERVSKKWHNFSNFLNDLPKIPGFYKWLDYPGEFNLDKDYYGTNIYDVSSCIFLNKKQRSDLQKYTPIKVSDGTSEQIFVTVQDVCNYYNLTRNTVKRMLAKKMKKDTLEMCLISHSNNFYYRKRIIYSQIEELINGIKNHPFSRRNIVTTWIPEDMTNPLVNPTNCHNSLTQCFVEPDNSLHMTMVQRSSDVVLGLPHNWIAQWAVLMWLAHKTDKKVGSFTWIGGDCHIYQDHVIASNEIIDAADNGAHADVMPKLVYTPTSDDFKADDFTMENDVKPVVTSKIKMTV